MVESFTKGLVNKIMVEVLDNLDKKNFPGKYWKVDCPADGHECLPELPAQANVQADVERSDFQAAETIGRILSNMRDVQIGDWSYTVPPMTTLERQVKGAINNVKNVDDKELANISAAYEQGDNENHVQLLESVRYSSFKPMKSKEITEKEIVAEKEAADNSISLFNRMIEEYKTADEIMFEKLKNEAWPEEEIASHEEKEEQLVRIIEGPSDQDDSRNTSRFNSMMNICFVNHEILNSLFSSRTNSNSLPRGLQMKEITMEKVTVEPMTSTSLETVGSIDKSILSNEIQEPASSDGKLVKNKLKMSKRIKKIFRNIFKYRKNQKNKDNTE